MTRVTPYLRFKDNQTAEAMEFYKSVFGGELDLQKVSDTPMAAQMSAEAQPAVMHSTLTAGDFRILASDMIKDGEKLTIGDDISLALIGTKAEVTELYEKLRDGGEIISELKEEFFGMFGEVRDKFGKLWMFSTEPESKS